MPHQLPILQSITLQTQHHPHRLAITDAQQSLTYGELDARANQLAHQLLACGAQSGGHIGLSCPRGVELVIGMLGILKAGCAYVPIDIDAPLPRQTMMAHDADVNVVVTTTRLQGRLALAGTVLCLDNVGAMQAYPTTAPDVVIDDADLAYILFTSGSTGVPKGVEITHGNLAHLIDWHLSTFAVQPQDRASQVTNATFDATGWEIWPYLAAGASVHVVQDEVRAHAPALHDWLIAHQITIAFVPTPMAERLIALPWPEEGSLRAMLTGADTLRHFPPYALPFPLINNYGPTEATVVATSGRVPPAGEGLPTIGKPIGQTTVHILDRTLQPVPPGAIGEIYLSGPAVGRGYCRAPELTAERFIPDPWHPGGRLYRTGDSGEWLPDGEIAFHGRADFQIKVRGYRIEPEEVMTALRLHPALRECVVVAQPDQDDENQLVAYIVFHEGAVPSAHDLRQTVRRMLPEYMVPATFVRLAELPYTVNGKLARAALPRPDATNRLPEETVAEHQTTLQARLATIVGGLLRTSQVPLDANFFLMGGHSLLGAQLLAAIANEYGVALGMRALFTMPTIRQLAQAVEEQQRDALVQSALVVQPEMPVEAQR